MEKQRKYKTFSIIALMFAVVALSVGFAAFQKIMNISSSATVKLPNEEKLKLTLYGYIDQTEAEKVFSGTVDFSKWSKEVSYAMIGSNFIAEKAATINSDNLTINIDKVNITGEDNMYQYLFLLKNESDYGVYLKLDDNVEATYKTNSINEYRLKATCTTNDGSTPEWVNSVCDNIYLDVFIDGIKGRSKLVAGKYTVIVATVVANYDDNFEDDVVAQFPQIKILFDLVPFN